MNSRFAVLTTFVALYFQGLAQPVKPDTSFLSAAVRFNMERYVLSMKQQSLINNGTEYAEYLSLDEEHPYLINEWLDGTVSYDGQVYENVPLLYDTRTDNIVTEHYASAQKVQLVKARVEYFIIQKRRFVQLRNDQIQKGFYELVYGGPTSFYVRREKSLQETLTETTVEHSFLEKISYYLCKQGSYYPVSTKREVLALFRDHKSEVNQFLNKNKIRFKSNKESSIARMAEYYDSISK